MKRIIITTVFLTLYGMLCGQVVDTFRFKASDYGRFKPDARFTIPRDTLAKLIPLASGCTVTTPNFKIIDGSKNGIDFTNGRLVWSFVDSNYNLVAYKVNEGKLVILDSMGMINVLMAELDKLKYFIKNN